MVADGVQVVAEVILELLVERLVEENHKARLIAVAKRRLGFLFLCLFLLCGSIRVQDPAKIRLLALKALIGALEELHQALSAGVHNARLL